MSEETQTNENQLLAVVQVRGLATVKATVKDTLRLLGLSRVNQLVFVKSDSSSLGMLKKVKDYVTWGPVSKEMVSKMLEKRGEEYLGRSMDAKEKYSYRCFEFDGKKYKKRLRLNPPRKGFGRGGVKVAFAAGGALGNRGEKIVDLLERMI